MLSIHKYKKLTWINLESPTSEEVKSLVTKYKVHPIIADELLRPTIRPKVDSYKDSIFLILHFPIHNPVTHISSSCEIDFIIGKDFLITTHYKTITPLHEMIKDFQTDSVLKDTDMAKNVGVLVFYIMRRMYEFSLRQLDHIHEKIVNIEEKVFNKKFSMAYEMVQEISYMRRDILDFRRIIQPHKEVLSSFEIAGKKFIGNDFSHYINNTIGDYFRVWNTLQAHKEAIESIQSTHDSMLSHRINEIMKILTIMAFVTFPLMLIASLFGMNTKILPIVGMPGDFWVILGIMLLGTIAMFLFFKQKKWL